MARCGSGHWASNRRDSLGTRVEFRLGGRCNPTGAVLVISDIWRCDGRETLPHA